MSSSTPTQRPSLPPRVRRRFRRPRLRRFGQVGVSLAFVLMLTPMARPLALGLLGADRLWSAALGLVYDLPKPAPVRAQAARYRLEGARVVARVEPRFLSIAVDASQVAGGNWWSADGRKELLVGSTRVAPFDFGRPRLLHLAQALAPAYLRVGGTEADRLSYDLSPDSLPDGQDGRAGDALWLSRAQWDALNAFVGEAGLSLMFTANAGPVARDGVGAWKPSHLLPLLRYSAQRGYDVPVWELGNEVNAFAFTHGLGARVPARTYAQDVARFAESVHRYFPDARIAAGASFAWPVMGEMPAGFTADFVEQAGAGAHAGSDAAVLPDILTWHYYPQQSRRCALATRRASPARLLEPAYLDEFQRIGAHFRGLSARHEGMQTWVGETGNAQCGGEPGVSDRFAGSLWWLDQLGLAAASGEQVVVRQTLTGSDYGLLDSVTLAPRPDYWASLLWKQTMGERVVGLTAEQRNPHLRVYTHCHPAGDGRVSLLAINLASTPRSLSLADASLAGASLYRVEADGLAASQVRLNGRTLSLGEGDRLPALAPVPAANAALSLAPRSYAFVVLKTALPACRAR